ncbi:hypothetical protein PIB30_089214 [Stylosanthes scabra]|uniref:Uncharacterized protein n=1 Tax=Stylosanthes scabra TaxID=79078 RepID=A0ABU6ZSK0_9FABA|nr:hypothetical protein [Stylosanthes scabra]
MLGVRKHWLGEEKKRRKDTGGSLVGERCGLWKRSDGSYIHDDAQAVGVGTFQWQRRPLLKVIPQAKII